VSVPTPARIAAYARRNPLLLAASLLALAAAVCAGWFGSSWYSAAHDSGADLAQARDAALRDGEQAVQNMNTLDYRSVSQGMALWEQSTTGDLHTQLTGGASSFEKEVQQAKTVTTAKVLDGAITELDPAQGKASLMVAVQITVTPDGGKATTKQSRMLGQLTRTSAGWKLSALSDAPVDEGSGSGAGASASPSPSASPSASASASSK